MGKGKKNKNCSLEKKVDGLWTVNSSPTARNLPKNELGAVIFGCKHHTFAECLDKKIFGLPAAHHSYVKNVTPGMALFLFNYSDRKLHGIFEAVSSGQMELDKHAWSTCEGVHLTPYAAQVRVDSRMTCRPLSEEEFKPVIKKNYYAEKLFWFELDKEQTDRLIKLFLSSQLPAKLPHPPKPTGWGEMKSKESDSSYASVLINTDASASETKWTDLFTTSSSLHQEMSKPPPEHCQDAAIVESDSQEVDSLEEHAHVEHNPQEIYENAEPHLQFHELDSERLDLTVVPLPSSDNTIFPDREGCESETSGSQIQSDLTSRALSENPNALSGRVLTDTQSSVFESVIIKMAQEIERLKSCQLKQRLRMVSLEQELVHSKLEIDQLKRRCHRLESMPSSASDHYNVDCGSPDFKSEESVYFVGGFDGVSWLSDLTLYSPSQDSVLSLCPMTFPRRSASVAKLNGELYVFGGFHDGVWYDKVESYNPMMNQWITRPSLNKKKGSLAGASLYGTIFAIGGGNGVECFSEVELLDPNIGSWMPTQSMLEKRYASAAADLNGALYVAGGFDGKEYLKSVERFDPREHAWTKVASMNSKRGCHSLIAVGEELYALGGYDGDTVGSTVEVFDPRLGSWMMEESMKVSRVNFGSFVFGGKIYVIGGERDTEVLDVIERYEEGSGWQVIGNSNIGKRCLFSAVVM